MKNQTKGPQTKQKYIVNFSRLDHLHLSFCRKLTGVKKVNK